MHFRSSAQSNFQVQKMSFCPQISTIAKANTKTRLVDAGASFESTMKCICDTLRWKYEKGTRASDLLKVLKEHQLFPDYLDRSLDQLLAVLKTGLPEVRSNEGSHGQRSVPKRVPAHVAAYAIHLAATNIVFLVECMKHFQSQIKK